MNSPGKRDLILIAMAGHDVKRIIEEVCVVINSYLQDVNRFVSTDEAHYFATCVKKMQLASGDMALSVDELLAVLAKESAVLEPLRELQQLTYGNYPAALQLASSRMSNGEYALDWHDAPPNPWMM